MSSEGVSDLQRLDDAPVAFALAAPARQTEARTQPQPLVFEEDAAGQEARVDGGRAAAPAQKRSKLEELMAKVCCTCIVGGERGPKPAIPWTLLTTARWSAVLGHCTGATAGPRLLAP